MTKQRRGIAKMILGVLLALGGLIFGSKLFLSGLEDATSTTEFGACGFGELADEEGNCP